MGMSGGERRDTSGTIGFTRYAWYRGTIDRGVVLWYRWNRRGFLSASEASCVCVV
ncbi:MAG: hypothetical protein NC212_10820 [Staphylococcus sp.]|nr:hypothetical protein [Staphylococcus sp.]